MEPTYQKNIIFSLLLSALTLLVACKKFVEVNPPNTQLVTATVFNNSATATSAMTNIYQLMYKNNESYNLALQTGFLGDELKRYSPNTQFIQYYTNAMTAAAPNTFGPWNNAYSYIYQANAIIEGLQNNTGIAQPVQRQLTGEAKFVRAFWNFYLTNCYGDVPLTTSSDYTINASLIRTPQAQVYQQIISDLKDAQNLLNSGFVDASDTTVYAISTAERVRPTKWAATALLARAYLYTKDYTNSEIQATAVINNTSMFHLVTDLNKVFAMNSFEAIWQLGIPLPNSKNTVDGANFILTGTPTVQSISSQLINAFEAGDSRETNWVGSYTSTTAPISTYYYPYKYKVKIGTAISEYTMVLRLAEQYLIRAEARANGAGIGINGAISDLNIIRNRANLANYTGLTDKSSVLAAILHERQVELFTEWGNRWYDLIRTGNADAVMGSPGNVCQSKGGTWSSNWTLFPIPQTERNNDPNLSQNTGY